MSTLNSQFPAIAQTSRKWLPKGHGDFLRMKKEDAVVHRLATPLLIRLHAAQILHEPSIEVAERALASLMESINEQTVGNTFGSRLCSAHEEEFLDVLHEIAVAGAVSTVADPSSVELEKSLPGSRKNSDVYGLAGGSPFRVEVKTVHDDWPPARDTKLAQRVERAKTVCHFEADLRYRPSEESVDQIRVLIERIDSERSSLNLGGYSFDTSDGPFSIRSTDNACPIEALRFDPSLPANLVTPPAYTRPMIDRHEAEMLGYEQPVGYSGPGPLSTRIGQAIQEKVAQCEDGVVNIVAIATPSSPAEHDVGDAVHGVLGVIFAADGAGEGKPFRIPTGPFTPAANSADAENLTDPYRRISAVWHVRLGLKPVSRIHLNPNASTAMSDDLKRRLENSLPDHDRVPT